VHLRQVRLLAVPHPLGLLQVLGGLSVQLLARQDDAQLIVVLQADGTSCETLMGKMMQEVRQAGGTLTCEYEPNVGQCRVAEASEWMCGHTNPSGRSK
jgi:hypothetical protein